MINQVGWDQRQLSRAGPPMAACTHGGPALAVLAGPTLLRLADRSLAGLPKLEETRVFQMGCLWLPEDFAIFHHEHDLSHG